MTIRIGTRGSRLSLIQTHHVIDALLREWPEHQFEVVSIRTEGDIDRESPIYEISTKGIFEKNIDLALVAEEIDVAVHSLKDLPSDATGILIAAVPERGSPNDVVVSRNGEGLRELPRDSVIGTSSPRRRWQIERVRDDVQVKPMRGNVDTRVRKVREGEYDAAILAEAGLARLGMEEVASQRLSLEDFTPAPGQGALAVVCRPDDEKTRNLLSKIDHTDSRASITAERAFLKEVRAGCKVPLGAYGHVDGSTLTLRVSLQTPQGETWSDRISGSTQDAANLGKSLGGKVVSRFGTFQQDQQ